MEVSATHIEEREISAIDDLLPSLLKRGLLTDIECRSIACSRNLPEKQSAIYRIIIFKNKQKADKLVEVFRAMTEGLHPKEELQLQESDHKHLKNEINSPFKENKNPMLIDTVIKCVFGFLPLDDIKNCRLVSRQWNSTAEVLLRKRAKIHFCPDGVRTETFLAVAKFALPDLPFSAFKFSEQNTDSSWCEAELGDFFEKWGKNIKELDLDNINIESADDSLELLTKYDVTPWFEHASKITSLTIACSKEGVTEEDGQVLYVNTAMSLDKCAPLSEIKTIILKENSITNFSAEGNSRISPVNIELSNITCTRNDEDLQQFRYNDFFDFSQAVTIRLNNCKRKISEATFDMGDQVLQNTDLLHLNKITVENWENAQGSVRSVELRGIPFTVKNNLKIQSLKITGESLDLFALPPTIERIETTFCDVSCSQPLCLPKLKFLQFHWDKDPDNSFQLRNFQLDKCENLKELVLSNYDYEETGLTQMFNVRSLPINLQILRIKGNIQSYLTDDWILEMPSGFVVFDATVGGSYLSDYTRIAEKFRVGTLVVICHMHMNISTGDIVEYLLANMQRETKRIFLGMKCEEDDLFSQSIFEGSIFSTMVDAKSNYYEFQNVRGILGKAITREQFFNGGISVGDELIPFFTEDEINDKHITP